MIAQAARHYNEEFLRFLAVRLIEVRQAAAV
jgi:hypothetical protein